VTVKTVESQPPRIGNEGSPGAAGLVERYFMDVYAVGLKVLGHPQDAEDAAQETFLALVRGRDRLEAAESERAWVLTVARNTAVSLLRKRRAARAVPEPATAAPPIAEPVDRARLHEALASLPEADREVIVMRFLEGKSAEEMAAATGKTRGALATALCRALARLRGIYGAAR
jgi:RNA polymerase sigma-70 factor (ECF subfamily)